MLYYYNCQAYSPSIGLVHLSRAESCSVIQDVSVNDTFFHVSHNFLIDISLSEVLDHMAHVLMQIQGL